MAKANSKEPLNIGTEAILTTTRVLTLAKCAHFSSTAQTKEKYYGREKLDVELLDVLMISCSCYVLSSRENVEKERPGERVRWI